MNLLKTNKCTYFGYQLPKLIFFTGKGGVGKTSTASIFGSYLARKNNKVLIISTDPAHSLADFFQTKLIAGKIIRYKERNSLYLLELALNPNHINENYSKSNFFSEIIYPSSEEFLITMEVAKIIMNIVRTNSNFDYVIFDMAPSGHSLRILEFPSKLKNYMKKITDFGNKISTLNEKTNNIHQKRKKIYKKNKETINTLNILSNLLKKPEVSQFVIVGIPEYLSIIESKRLFQDMADLGLSCNNMIINKIEAQTNSLCKFCMNRSKFQKKNIDIIRSSFKELNIIQIPLFSHELQIGRFSECLEKQIVNLL